MRRLTHNEQVAAIAKVNPDVEILGEITGNTVKVLCLCKICHHEWEARPDNLKNGEGCPECKKVKIGNAHRLTNAEHVAAIKKVNPNIEILEEIKSAKQKVLCRCLVCSHKWRAAPDKLKQSRGCPECAKIKRANAKRKTHAEQIAAIDKVNPSIEILGEIINATNKVPCRCKICSHRWEARPYSLKAGCGCPVCAEIKSADAKRKTHAEQVAEIAAKNPNVEVLGKIINARTKVLCRCKICNHKWETLPNCLKKGHGCPKCAGVAKLSHKEHVAAINKVNPDVEVLEEIKSSLKKVLCKCRICQHEWNATPACLKSGKGCPACAGNKKLSHKEQIEAISRVNPNVEVLGEIKNNKTKVLCRCAVCSHKWLAKVTHLKQRHGCPRCAKRGFLGNDFGKLYIMVDDLNVPTMMKIGVSVQEDKRSREVLNSAHKAGVSIPALHVAKTWEGPTDLMQRIEGMMHENYAEWNIKFPTKFDGYTEFFYYTHETAGVFDAIDDFYYTVVNQF